MGDKNDLIFKLYKTQIERWNERRTYEWKVTLTLWSGIAVATGYLAGKLRLGKVHILIYAFVFLLYVFIWLRGLWVANTIDKKLANYYRKVLTDYLGILDEPQIMRDRMKWVYDMENWASHSMAQFEFLLDWSMAWQAVFTGILLFLSWYVLSDGRMEFIC